MWSDARHNFKILIHKDIDLTKSRDFPYGSLDKAWMPLDRVLNMQCPTIFQVLKILPANF